MLVSTGNSVVVAALYKFADLPHYEDLRSPLKQLCEKYGVLGTLLLAQEGINGTIAGPADGIEAVLKLLKSQPGFEDLQEKRSYCDKPPFYRMKVRLKREIVTMGDEEIDPTRRVGTYVDPKKFNQLIEDPEVLVIDTRNVYETRVGTFSGAMDPGIDTFRDFPEWVNKNLDPAKNKKVAMFCTGGIRCEKATSLMLREGFEEVYHLEGGILKYLAETSDDNSKWQGECFVFDHRVSVDSQLQPGSHQLCFGCLEPITHDDRESPKYEYGVSCPHCFDKITEKDRERRRERARQMTRARENGEAHIGSMVSMPASKSKPNQDRTFDGVLYSFRRCPYAMRARMALSAGDYDVEIREVVLRDKPPELLELGSSTVPVLTLPSGETLKESLDIMNWVRTQKPKAMNYRMVPELDALIEVNDQKFKHELDRYKYPSRYPDEDTSGAREKAVACLKAYEAEFRDEPFLDGSQPGFHDAALFPFVRQFAGVESDWFQAQSEQGLGKVVAWHNVMIEHPFFLRIMKKLRQWHSKDTPVSFKDVFSG